MLCSVKMASFCFCTRPPSTDSILAPSSISGPTYLAMVDGTRCTTMKDLRTIHAQLIKTGFADNAFSASRVLSFCASKSGDVYYARHVFDRITRKNLFVWNTMIRGLSRSSTPLDAIFLFIEMVEFSDVEPCRLTYPSVFKAYAVLGLAEDGAQLHGRVIKLGLQTDPFIRNTLVYMYVNCGFLSQAWALFSKIEEFDVVACNSMVIGLAKSGKIDDSLRLFSRMPARNSVSWNSMISGLVRNGKFLEALDFFRQMQQEKEKIEPCEFTMVSLLNASAGLGALNQGEWIHDYIKRKSMELNAIVVTAIIDMYCKCGCIEKAVEVFKTSTEKGLSSWNTMILGLAMNGYEEEAIQLFLRLEASNNLRPDEVSFVGVLTACSHAGLVHKARQYFSAITKTYNLTPSLKHYGCLVDVLGRAGLLDEAMKIIRSMPMEPDAIIWGSLLSACEKHGDIKMAEVAAKCLMELDPSESSSYVLMANAYRASDQLEESIEQRLAMKERRVVKEPGCSLIDVNGEVHEFVASGVMHPQTEDIYSLLRGLMLVILQEH